MRTWQVERRKRTRHLIELGGLVVKAGIVELTGDDRAMIYGALLWMTDKLQSDQGEQAQALWAAKGKQALGNDYHAHDRHLVPCHTAVCDRKVGCQEVDRKWLAFGQRYARDPHPIGHCWIISSAVANSVSGMVRPRALAVLRLNTKSYLRGCCTGRSAGFSPLRIRST